MKWSTYLSQIKKEFEPIKQCTNADCKCPRHGEMSLRISGAPVNWHYKGVCPKCYVETYKQVYKVANELFPDWKYAFPRAYKKGIHVVVDEKYAITLENSCWRSDETLHLEYSKLQASEELSFFLKDFEAYIKRARVKHEQFIEKEGLKDKIKFGKQTVQWAEKILSTQLKMAIKIQSPIKRKQESMVEEDPLHDIKRVFVVSEDSQWIPITEKNFDDIKEHYEAAMQKLNKE